MAHMSEAQPSYEPAQVPDWEAFYANYRKPGYIQGFEIGPKLGGGMFGIVYKARRESIGKSYAIKFLRLEDPGVRDQVVRELDSVALFAQVDHPNLVSIEDRGVVDGIPYIVMGYAGEETLRDRLEAGNLAEDEKLRIFAQIARGVSALHEHALVHFDLKPANVFLMGDIARVGDYGLSKLMTESAMSLTTGRGTPYYMAPELLRRKGDHRSDIYSLGVLLFELLSGEVPFSGENEWEVLKGHEEKPVAFPSSIPMHYHALLSKALAKRPEDRFATVADFIEALRHIVGPTVGPAVGPESTRAAIATQTCEWRASVGTPTPTSRLPRHARSPSTRHPKRAAASPALKLVLFAGVLLGYVVLVADATPKPVPYEYAIATHERPSLLEGVEATATASVDELVANSIAAIDAGEAKLEAVLRTLQANVLEGVRRRLKQLEASLPATGASKYSRGLRVIDRLQAERKVHGLQDPPSSK